MKSIIISYILHNQTKSKLCTNCKFIIKGNIKDRYSKCLLFPNIKKNDYNYCIVARGNNNKCGENGVMYIKKEKNYSKI